LASARCTSRPAKPSVQVSPSRRVELAGSAHFPWYDQPAEFFTALDAWYADQTARTPS
jgi:pimeloyl-ACP methyl ester carboxylesterase